MDSEKSKLSRDAKEYRNKSISRMALQMNENTALILAYVYKVCKKESLERASRGVTINELVEGTRLNSTKIRRELEILTVTCFVSRVTESHEWRYFITEDGLDALTFMLGEYHFPGRKAKIMAIIDTKKKG